MSFYVNFLLNNNDFENDNPLKPMGWFDLLNAPAGDYYCQGNREDLLCNLYLADKHLKPWSLSAYGPWRINVNKLTGTIFSSSNSWSLQGGIVSANDIVLQGAGSQRHYSFYNMYFVLNNFFTISSELNNIVSVDFKGCILRCDMISANEEFLLDNINFENSIVVVDSNVNRGGNFVNSVFNRSRIAWNNASITECQFDFVPPTWPMWNAIKDAWKYSILGINISIVSSGQFNEYEYGLFGNLRSTSAGIGTFFFDVNNYRLIVVQKINRHIIKRFDSNISPATFDGQYYGIYKEAGRLRFPQGCCNSDTNIFLCDYKNNRIVCFDKELNFLYEYLMNVNDGRPYLVYYDNLSNCLYVLRVISNFWNMKIERLQVYGDRLESVKLSGLLGKMKDAQMPTGFCKGFSNSDFFITGVDNDIVRVVEYLNSFSSFYYNEILGHEPARYMGIIKHSNGYIYLNDGCKIVKIDSTFENIGYSNDISFVSSGLKQAKENSMIAYNNDDMSLLRFDEEMNFLETIFVDSSDDISLDIEDVVDFVEINLM